MSSRRNETLLSHGPLSIGKSAILNGLLGGVTAGPMLTATSCSPGGGSAGATPLIV